MKKTILLSLLCINFSYGQIMVLFEVETPDKNNMTQIAQNWFNAMQAVNGDTNGISMHNKGWNSKGVYFVQWFDDLSDMAETMEKQEKMSEKIIKHLESTPSNPDDLVAFNSISDPKQSSVWEYVPELSMMSDWSKLSQKEKDQMNYRRFSFINTGMNAQNEFEAFRKKGNELDKKRGVNYHMAVFRNIFGGKDSDYLTIIIDKSRIDYMKNFIGRMEKRRNSPGWENNQNPWDLNKYNTIKSEEIYKNVDFKLSDKK